MKFQILQLLLLLLCFAASSQNKSDTVSVKSGYILIRNGKPYYASKDTTFLIPDTIIYSLKKSRSKQSEDFYEFLKQKSYSSVLTQELFNFIYRPPNKPQLVDTFENKQAYLQYLPYDGKIIRSVKIQKLNVFGPSIYDTTQKARTFLGRTGNYMHINTLDRIIYNNLLFAESDLFDPVTVADNERILRDLSFIDDTKIIAKCTSADCDSVDIFIITKDKWNIGLDATVDDIHSTEFDLYDRNIAGTGLLYEATMLLNTDLDPMYGYQTRFKMSNIAGSFIAGQFKYLNAFDKENYELYLDRRFFSNTTKYAGGIRFLHNNSFVNIANDTSLLLEKIPLAYDYQNVWVGKSFLLQKGYKRSNIIISAKVSSTDYYQSPEITSDSRYLFHDKFFVLGNIAYSLSDYFKSQYIYNIGRTEDIPFGSLIQFTGGAEINNYTQRAYLGMGISNANLFKRLGYYYLSASFGSFLYNKKLEQTTIRFEANNFTRLFELGDYKIRQFLKINYIIGINRFSDEYITINNKYGIRGFSSNNITGMSKLVANIETVIFTTWEFIGFRFAFFGFGDLALIGKNKTLFSDKNFYSGFGLGFKIRNENLLFNTIQVRLAYYPNLPFEAIYKTTEFSGIQTYRLNDLKTGEPATVDFY